MNAMQGGQDIVCLMLDHYRAAQIVLEQYGPQGESEILRHISVMADREDHEGAYLWLCVLAAYDELCCLQTKATVLH
jgi:hypothetical protein